MENAENQYGQESPGHLQISQSLKAAFGPSPLAMLFPRVIIRHVFLTHTSDVFVHCGSLMTDGTFLVNSWSTKFPNLKETILEILVI